LTLYTHKNKIDSALLYEGRIINLRVDKLRDETGSISVREIVEHNGGVVIACEPEPNHIILIKQYRYPIDEELIELPAGRIERGEPPLPAAQRELIEETGYQARKWQELARMYSAPGFCNELLYLYHATDTAHVGKKLDEDEETEVLILPFKEAWQLVISNKVHDAKTIAGLGILVNRQT
jgi:ADP-ribose pyrophosphatase